MQAKPIENDGPGWYVDPGNGTMYQLWAPNAHRDHWVASWSTRSTIDYRQGDSAAEVLDVFTSHPQRETTAVARSLLYAAGRPNGRGNGADLR